jgi:DNA (cytosine-5)-methyltransferase 1
VVSGGFPCQDISAVGKGAGIEGERSGLWKEMARVVCEVRPRFVFVENSPMLLTRGMGTVLRDLAEMGFDARWGVLGAGHIGAPHARERVWILAYAKSERAGMDERRIRRLYSEGCMEERRRAWPSDAGILRVADGVANRTHRIKAAGNGQVPRVAAAAWRILTANAQVTGAAPTGDSKSDER